MISARQISMTNFSSNVSNLQLTGPHAIPGTGHILFINIPAPRHKAIWHPSGGHGSPG